jgi:transcriptional regulator with XRE-family HTH domain
VDLLKHIGEKIRSQILRSGYASIELYAHENDIPKSTLSEIITGKNDPRLSTLARICAGLDMTLSDLFRDPALDAWVRERAPKYASRRSASASKGLKENGGKRV